MTRPIVECVNYTERGARLGRAFQAHPDLWLKRLRNVAVVQCAMGFIALSVWVITWLHGLDRRLPQYHGKHPIEGVNVTEESAAAVSRQHGALFGGHVCLAAISTVVGAAAAGIHGGAAYNRAIAWTLVLIDIVAITGGYVVAYVMSVRFYSAQISTFAPSIVGVLVASCFAAVAALVAGLLELLCVIVPPPPVEPPPPAPAPGPFGAFAMDDNGQDPWGRVIDDERIPLCLLELQDATNYLLFNRNANQANIPNPASNIMMTFQQNAAHQQPQHPPFLPVGMRNRAPPTGTPHPRPYLFPYGHIMNSCVPPNSNMYPWGWGIL